MNNNNNNENTIINLNEVEETKFEYEINDYDNNIHIMPQGIVNSFEEELARLDSMRENLVDNSIGSEINDEVEVEEYLESEEEESEEREELVEEEPEIVEETGFSVEAVGIQRRNTHYSNYPGNQGTAIKDGVMTTQQFLNFNKIFESEPNSSTMTAAIDYLVQTGLTPNIPASVKDLNNKAKAEYPFLVKQPFSGNYNSATLNQLAEKLVEVGVASKVEVGQSGGLPYHVTTLRNTTNIDEIEMTISGGMKVQASRYTGYKQASVREMRQLLVHLVTGTEGLTEENLNETIEFWAQKVAEVGRFARTGGPTGAWFCYLTGMYPILKNNNLIGYEEVDTTNIAYVKNSVSIPYFEDIGENLVDRENTMFTLNILDKMFPYEGNLADIYSDDNMSEGISMNEFLTEIWKIYLGTKSTTASRTAFYNEIRKTDEENLKGATIVTLNTKYEHLIDQLLAGDLRALKQLVEGEIPDSNWLSLITHTLKNKMEVTDKDILSRVYFTGSKIFTSFETFVITRNFFKRNGINKTFINTPGFPSAIGVNLTTALKTDNNKYVTAVEVFMDGLVQGMVSWFEEFKQYFFVAAYGDDQIAIELKENHNAVEEYFYLQTSMEKLIWLEDNAYCYSPDYSKFDGGCSREKDMFKLFALNKGFDGWMKGIIDTYCDNSSTIVQLGDTLLAMDYLTSGGGGTSQAGVFALICRDIYAYFANEFQPQGQILAKIFALLHFDYDCKLKDIGERKFRDIEFLGKQIDFLSVLDNGKVITIPVFSNKRDKFYAGWHCKKVVKQSYDGESRIIKYSQYLSRVILAITMPEFQNSLKQLHGLAVEAYDLCIEKEGVKDNDKRFSEQEVAEKTAEVADEEIKNVILSVGTKGVPPLSTLFKIVTGYESPSIKKSKMIIIDNKSTTKTPSITKSYSGATTSYPWASFLTSKPAKIRKPVEAKKPDLTSNTKIVSSKKTKVNSKGVPPPSRLPPKPPKRTPPKPPAKKAGTSKQHAEKAKQKQKQKLSKQKETKNNKTNKSKRSSKVTKQNNNSNKVTVTKGADVRALAKGKAQSNKIKQNTVSNEALKVTNKNIVPSGNHSNSVVGPDVNHNEVGVKISFAQYKRIKIIVENSKFIVAEPHRKLILRSILKATKKRFNRKNAIPKESQLYDYDEDPDEYFHMFQEIETLPFNEETHEFIFEIFTVFFTK